MCVVGRWVPFFGGWQEQFHVRLIAKEQHSRLNPGHSCCNFANVRSSEFEPSSSCSTFLWAIQPTLLFCRKTTENMIGRQITWKDATGWAQPCLSGLAGFRDGTKCLSAGFISLAIPLRTLGTVYHCWLCCLLQRLLALPLTKA